ncbi:hypothetical protein LJC48_02505 [Desulfovibrio sp. OttesenSCG-928-C06]|nr:hypothetical protein [Desulfovibrio sp. OttesenSCG-928-C06]
MFEDSTAVYILTRFGYLAVLGGAAVENSTILLVAGVLAERGYLSLPLVMLGGLVCSALAGQGLFMLSRFRAANLFARFPRLAARADAVCRNVSDMPRALHFFAFMFRWCWGVKNLAPVFLGRTSIKNLWFGVLNLLGAAIWASAFSLAGYGFSSAVEGAFGSMFIFELALLVLAAVLPALIAWRRLHGGKCKDTGK